MGKLDENKVIELCEKQKEICYEKAKYLLLEIISENGRLVTPDLFKNEMMSVENVAKNLTNKHKKQIKI